MRGGSVLPGASSHIACLGGARGQRAGRLGPCQQTLTPPAASEEPRSLGRKCCQGLRDMQSQPTVGGGAVCPSRGPHPALGARPRPLRPASTAALPDSGFPVDSASGGATRPGGHAPCPLPARSGPRCVAPTALVTRPLTAPQSTGLKTHTHLPLKTQCGNSLGCGLPRGLCPGVPCGLCPDLPRGPHRGLCCDLCNDLHCDQLQGQVRLLF